MAIDIDAAYRRFGPLVYRRCLRLLGSPALAEEAMQDVFVRVLVHGQDFDDRALSSLLFRIATHVSLNRLRDRKRRPQGSEDELLRQIAEGDEPEQNNLVAQLLDRLFGREPASTRVMATLHYVDGMTLEEVAEELSMSVSGVRKRLRVLREKLTKLSKEHDDRAA